MSTNPAGKETDIWGRGAVLLWPGVGARPGCGLHSRVWPELKVV